VVAQTLLSDRNFGVGIHTISNTKPLMNNAEKNRNYSLIPSQTGSSQFSPIYYKKGGLSLGIHAHMEKEIRPKFWVQGRVFANYSGYKMHYNTLIARPTTTPNEPWIYTTEGETLAGFQTLKVHHVFYGAELGIRYSLYRKDNYDFSITGGVSFTADAYPLNHLIFDTSSFLMDSKTDKVLIRSNARRNNSIQVQPYIGFEYDCPLEGQQRSITISLKYTQLDMDKFYSHELFYFTAHNLKSVKNFEPNFGRIEFGLSYKWHK